MLAITSSSRPTRRRSLARAKVLLLAIVSALGPASAPLSAQASADEAAIRAAMLLNIARFTDWPAWKLDQDRSPFVICILGADPIDRYADKILDHQAINDKVVAVRHLKAGEPLDACHLLYTSVANRKLFTRERQEIARAAVLSVSELSNNVMPDQIVGLPVDGDHVRIEINLTLAQKSNLRISSRILRLATVTP